MGIVYDPELYRASEKYFAPYDMPGYAKNPFQTWHTDFVADNGYYATAMFSFTGPMKCVLLTIVDPQGNITETIQFIDDEDATWVKDGYDITLGSNYFRANFPILEMHVDDKDNDCGLDFKVEALIEPSFSELPDGVGIGRLNTPYMPVCISWYFMPWNRITGTLKLNGENIPVTGYGWSDHQFGTDNFFGPACHYFYWGNFPLGDNLITIFEAQGGPNQSYRPIKWLWNFKGDKIYSYDRDADFYIYTLDIAEGDTVPKTLKYVFESDRIRGVIDAKWKATLMKQPVDQPPFHAILNRSAYDCHAEMVIDGEKIEKDFVRILEACYSYEPTDDQRLVMKCDLGASVGGSAAVSPAEQTVPEPEEEVPAVDENLPGRFSKNSKLGDVIKDPEGCAVLEKYLPGISSDPNTKKGYGMKLKILFAMPATGVSRATLAQIDADLRAIK